MRTLIVTEYPLSEILDACIERQERVCDRYTGIDAWTVLAHLRVLRADLTLALDEPPTAQLECPCGKTADLCDNGLCYTWATKPWTWLRRRTRA